ncbi:hypothetical protein, partial [Staphylococcus aureus]|uniref:hypothetical protein n=1 Tax=Staphylococcus aureus TaxID=1280 RepID=UPI001F276E05
DSYHTNRQVHTGHQLMHLRGADKEPAKETPTSKPLSAKADKVENLMTLKQACPSEYQGAQCAFKDSMIH